GLCTLGDLERHDVAAAVDLALATSDRVVLLGASMGGIAVLRHAAQDTTGRVAGVVTVSSPASWRIPRSLRSLLAATMTQTGFGRRVARRFLNVRLAVGWNKPEPPVALAGRILVPVAVVHGLADRFISVHEATKLYGAAHG